MQTQTGIEIDIDRVCLRKPYSSYDPYGASDACGFVYV